VKKFISILLLSSYLIPAIGVGLNLHWCGHVLFSVSLDSDDHQNCFCTQFKEVGDDSKPDCCKDDYVYYKLSQQHTASYGSFFDHLEKSSIKSFTNSFPVLPLFNFSNQLKVGFYVLIITDESPPDLVMLGILRV
jgi:hypothetical protein